MADEASTFTDPRAAASGFDALLTVSARAGVDVLDPHDTRDVLDVLAELGARGDELLDVFHDYVHFRVETAAQDGWDEAHEVLEDALEDESGMPEEVAAALELDERLDPGLRRQALAEVLIVARVRDLLEWIGAGRAVTQTGALRRADIAPAAAFLGIEARGVAKLPADGEWREGATWVGDVAYVQSMRELPLLDAWWEALLAAELIEVTSTRLRRGAGAAAWLAEDLAPLDAAGALVAVFVAETLTGSLSEDADAWALARAQLTLAEAVRALDPAAPELEPRTEFERIFLEGAFHILARLARVGLLVDEGEGRLVAPEPLRGPVARGVVLAASLAAGVTGADDDFDDEPDPYDLSFPAELARHGIVHRPGMAAEMMQELAPLLAEEGIDLENLAGDDLDTLNEALSRATERHNLSLFTPVGEQRAMALTVHRLAAEALAEGSEQLAQAVVDGIQPDPVGNLPSVAQVIGIGLGVLDEWARESAGARALRDAQVPSWDAESERAAHDILAAAQRGEAFAELKALHLRHGGRLVLTGTVLAVAGGAIARAATEGTSVRDLVGRLLVAE